MPVGLFDESIDHAEAEAGPLANVLGGEEGFENVVQNAGGNAVAGINHRDRYVLSGGDIAMDGGIAVVEDDVAGLDDELAAVRHRVAGVEREIEDGACELTRVDQRARRIGTEHQVDLDLLAQHRTQQVGCLHYQRIDIDI